MHGTTVKIIETQQARLYTSHKNTKLKLLKTNIAIYNSNFSKLESCAP